MSCRILEREPHLPSTFVRSRFLKQCSQLAPACLATRIAPSTLGFPGRIFSFIILVITYSLDSSKSYLRRWILNCIHCALVPDVRSPCRPAHAFLSHTNLVMPVRSMLTDHTCLTHRARSSAILPCISSKGTQPVSWTHLYVRRLVEKDRS